jgi:hypothetical protein
MSGRVRYAEIVPQDCLLQNATLPEDRHNTFRFVLGHAFLNAINWHRLLPDPGRRNFRQDI